MQTRQTDLSRLLVGTKVFVVPQFQRHYKWKAPEWEALWEDLLEQFHSEDVQTGNLTKDEGHFLGSIVLHPAPGPASTVARYWVIDGQQRLTTLLILIAALRDFREQNDPGWNPAEYTDQFLSNPFSTESPYRLEPGVQDYEAFIETVYKGSPTGQQGRAYKWFYKAVKALNDQTGGIDYQKFSNSLLLRLLVVEINTSSEDNINQIFNTINYAGVQLSGVDLIRNHAFMQFKHDMARAVHERLWLPMERELGEDRLAQYLWAQIVRHNATATQRDIYGPFEKHLKALTRESQESKEIVVESELQRLHDEAYLYLNIVDRPHELAPAAPHTSIALAELLEWGSQTYVPLALETLSRLDRGEIDDSKAASALQTILSYFVRRALAGIPTNNLNRILSSVPSNITGSEDYVGSLLKELHRGGSYWPTDSEVIERGTSTAIYATLKPRQVKYILRKLSDDLNPVETVGADALTVEHIMPQELSEEWRTWFSAQDIDIDLAMSRVHVIGNLTVTGVNSELGRALPSSKWELLMNSNIPLNRELASEPHTSWSVEDIDRRSISLLRRAVSVWLRPVSIENESDSASSGAPGTLTLKMLLDHLPAESATPTDLLSQVLAVPESQVRDELHRLNYSVGMVDSEWRVGGLADYTEDELRQAPLITREQLNELIIGLGDN